MTATIANGPGNAAIGSGCTRRAPGRGQPSGVWKYLNGLATTAPASGVTGAAVTFTMPATPGTYNVRFFLNDTSTELATSSPVTVLGPSIVLSATTAWAGRDGDGDDRQRAG